MWLLFIAVAVLVLCAVSIFGMGIYALPVVILLMAIGVLFAMRIAKAAAEGTQDETPHRRTPTGRWDTAEGPEDPDRPRPTHEEKGVAHSGQERMVP